MSLATALRHPVKGRAGAAVAAVLALLVILSPQFSKAAPASAVEVSAQAQAQANAQAQADQPSETFVTVPAGPGQSGSIRIDTSLYLPDATPAPAVLLAHGFGGTKDDLSRQAIKLRDLGYVVLSYTARGFGRSGGQISLDSVDHEVADARALVDLLGERAEVESKDGDPEVAVVGGSYGGALGLMLGATDTRIDTVVSAITWNDLASALVPNNAIGSAMSQESERTTPAPINNATNGIFKEAWASQLFGSADQRSDNACGRFTDELCALYSKLVAGESLSRADRALLAKSSPASVLDRMTAPTLLLQGERDSLFGLDQADASARQIAGARTPVQVVWYGGGHDTGAQAASGQSSIEPTIEDWLAKWLPVGDEVTNTALDTAAAPEEPFTYAIPTGSETSAETREAAGYPGLGENASVASEEIRIGGRPHTIVNPPGGLPAAITSLPGLGTLLDGLGGAAAIEVPQEAQSAQFFSRDFSSNVTLVGAPSVTISVARDTEDGRTLGPDTASDAALYIGLYSVDDDDRTLVGGTVAPVRVPNLPADGTAVSVEVALPAAAYQFAAGTRLELWVSTTDALYQGMPDAASYRVDASGTLRLPTVPTAALIENRGAASLLTLAGIGGVLLVTLLLLLIPAIRRRRRRPALETAPAAITATAAAPSDPGSSDSAPSAPPPLVLRGLVKDFRTGQRAVDDLSFTVERGQVLGLLGPNGAGKTTTLRMAVGLIVPDAGSAEIFGETIRPGAAVLTRVGTFIEGPGFLPHLSGRRNLELFWAASGRNPEDSRMEEALAIADLGSAIDRRVRGYSQGMRQRLAIAQAMLGMPELLILDEPTNGLDPPQIFALRGVLRRYAESGRTVVVSSHLLGEVEQTCTHVVIMARGRLIASGTVAELAGEAGEVTLEVEDASAAQAALGQLGMRELQVLSPTTIRMLPDAIPVERVVEVLVDAGVGVRGIQSGRHLEDTFLDLVDSGIGTATATATATAEGTG